MTLRGILPSALLVLLVAVSAPLPTAGASTSDEVANDDAVKVLLVSIDALDPTQLDEDVAPTLVALRDQGTWWEEARGVMASETLPNHVAMATGTYPGTNGIPGNDGRLAEGDSEVADPDLGIRDARQATSIIAAFESQCPDRRSVTSLSKEYVWRSFVGEADADFDQPSFNIPESGHAPDSSTVPYIMQQEQEAPIDLLFANLGDHDRAGHIDATGAVPVPEGIEDGPRVTQRAALTQVDTWIAALVAQLENSGEWDRTVLFIVSDHTMNFTATLSDGSGDPAYNVDVGATLEQVEVDNGRDAGSTFLFSDNGGAGFVYLINPADPERETLLEQAYDAIADMEGVQDTLYRLPASFDPGGRALSTIHPAWNLHQTTRVGDILVLAEERYRLGSFTDNPLPGNHGHTSARQITALVTGGWDGIEAGQRIEASIPGSVDVADDTVALPEQAEQVDWAPTIGWLLGIEDPGVAAGGAPQWEGRVLEEAFTRQPGTLVCAAALDADDADDEDGEDVASDDEPAAAPATDDLAATGAGTGLVGVALLAAALAGMRRRPGRGQP